MNSDMMIKLALKLGEMTVAGTVSWLGYPIGFAPEDMSKDELIGDEYWSSEIDGKYFRIYEYGPKNIWSITPPKWLNVDVRLELWDKESKNCETKFPDNGAFSNLLNFVRKQNESFSESMKQYVQNSESTEQYVLKLVNAAS